MEWFFNTVNSSLPIDCITRYLEDQERCVSTIFVNPPVENTIALHAYEYTLYNEGSLLSSDFWYRLKNSSLV